MSIYILLYSHKLQIYLGIQENLSNGLDHLDRNRFMGQIVCSTNFLFTMMLLRLPWIISVPDIRQMLS